MRAPPAYIDRLDREGDWLMMLEALTFLYGETRARRMLLGRDVWANKDVERWRRLGEPRP